MRINKKYSISMLLFVMLVFTSIGAYFVGRQPILDVETQIRTIYIAILLSVLFLSFKNYRDVKYFDFSSVNSKKIQNIERMLIICGLFSLILYTYLLYNTFSLLLASEIVPDEFKNEGGAEMSWDSMIPHFYITLGNFLSPFGYICLAFHFYYLLQGNVKKAMLFFLLSSSIILNGLIALSRSATVQYILQYGIMFTFFIPLLSRKLVRKVLIYGGVVIFSAILALSVITSNRFSDYYTKLSLNDAIISEEDNPELFSAIDYFSQWEENGTIAMTRYKLGDISWGLYNSCGLAVHVQKIWKGSSAVMAEREKKYRNELLKEQASYFHGLITRLIFDFGYIGTILFIMYYGKIVRTCEPRGGIVSFKTILFLPILLPVCVTFWAGNALSSISLDLAIIYSYLIFLYIKR